MEFNEKLQALRKQKNLTQEELAEKLFVSRTAVSKWESGRGYPGIDSLKEIAKLFEVTIDELLSGNELLTIAEEDTKQIKTHFLDLAFGLLDISFVMFFFLPFFGQMADDVIREVSLLSLTNVSLWLKILYFVLVIIMALLGVITLSLQNLKNVFWINNKSKISLILNALVVLIFIVSRQPYAAGFSFIFLVIKTFLYIKRH